MVELTEAQLRSANKCRSIILIAGAIHERDKFQCVVPGERARISKEFFLSHTRLDLYQFNALERDKSTTVDV